MVEGARKKIFQGGPPLSTNERKEAFERRIVTGAVMPSFFAITQAVVELKCLYPSDLELVAISSEAWAILKTSSLWTKAIWEIRTRELLGVIE